MVEVKVLVSAPSGLHSRPCALICNFAKAQEDKIDIIYGEKKASAKSMFKLMALGVKSNTEIVINVEGGNEKDTAESIAKLISEIHE